MAKERDDRDDADAEEVFSTVVVRTAEGDLVHHGKYANEEAAELGAAQLPDQEVVATGELYKPPDAK